MHFASFIEFIFGIINDISWPHNFFVAVVVFVVFLTAALKLKYVFCNLSIFRFYYVLCII